jgi:L,D-transpeptidase ErfK/SrfK
VIRKFYSPIIVLCTLGSAVVSAAIFDLPPPEEAVIGQNLTVYAKASETLLDIARRYGIGYQEIKAANPKIDPWLPPEGAPVLLPLQYVLPQAPRKGMVINLAEMRLYYFPESSAGQRDVVITHPLGIGREGWLTPLGKTTVIAKKKDPAWIPPESIRAEHAANGDFLPPVVPPGPDNPLGKFALRLGIPGYLIHGTNRPWGVGMRVSHGCIRLYPEDIARLFEQVAIGTPVNVVYQPFKAGIRDKMLYLEAHASLVDLETATRSEASDMVAAIVAATTEPVPGINWELAKQIARDRTGVATRVSWVGMADSLP